MLGLKFRRRASNRLLLSLTLIALTPTTVTAEKVRHDVHAVVTGMVEARQSKPSLKGPQQREMIIRFSADNSVAPMVSIYDQQHLVRGCGVVVLVPHNHDGIVALIPGRRVLDRRHDPVYGNIALEDQSLVQACLRPIVILVEIAERAGVAASVLVIALVWRDEREIGNASRAEILEEAPGTLKSDDVAQTIVRVAAFLDIAEIDEGIVFGGVEFDDIALRVTLASNRRDVYVLNRPRSK